MIEKGRGYIIPTIQSMILAGVYAIWEQLPDKNINIMKILEKFVESFDEVIIEMKAWRDSAYHERR